MPTASDSEEQIRRLNATGAKTFRTCWQLLGIKPGSDAVTVTKAYKSISLLVHPDKVITDCAFRESVS